MRLRNFIRAVESKARAYMAPNRLESLARGHQDPLTTTYEECLGQPRQESATNSIA